MVSSKYLTYTSRSYHEPNWNLILLHFLNHQILPNLPLQLLPYPTFTFPSLPSLSFLHFSPLSNLIPQRISSTSIISQRLQPQSTPSPCPPYTSTSTSSPHPGDLYNVFPGCHRERPRRLEKRFPVFSDRRFRLLPVLLLWSWYSRQREEETFLQGLYCNLRSWWQRQWWPCLKQHHIVVTTSYFMVTTLYHRNQNVL